LNNASEDLDVQLTEKNISDRFSQLLKRVQEKYNKNVVILVDEYDKPILDFITRPEEAMQARELLKNFY